MSEGRIPQLTAAQAESLEKLARGPAARSVKASPRSVVFSVASRLVGMDLATFDADRGALSITAKGREALEAHRAGWVG